MRNATVARRYAKALYELAHESKTLDDVLLGLGNVCTALKSVPELKKILLNPLVKPEQKQALIKTVTSNKLIMKFTALLARRKRLALIEWVFEQLQGLDDAARGIHRALVKTAVPLTEAQKKSIESNLARVAGGSVVGRFEVAKELVGGVWAKLGDQVLDASIKGRVEDFRHALIHSAN